MKAESIEKIIEFLEKQGIKVKHEQHEGIKFNRIIEFEVENATYYIEWWVNQSYFKLKNEFSTPYLPFKFIEINPNCPTALHKFQLCFYDEEVTGDKDNMLYNPIPWGCMRIPFNKI